MIPLHRVEINITELCNRTCYFCPRAVDYPNKNLHMTPEVAEQVFIQTDPYTTFISMAGRGEPLLGKHLYEICELAKKHKRHMRIITNGDTLDKHIDELDKIFNLKYPRQRAIIQVNCYDGPKQKTEWSETYREFKAITFDDKHQTAKPQEWEWGTDITNRGGFMWQTERLEFLKKPCFFLWYKTFIDYNGNVNLCCHDWTHMRNFGNIMEKPFSEIWEGEELNEYRKILEKGERWRLPECKNCDNFQEWDKQNLYYEYRKHPARTFFESNLL